MDINDNGNVSLLDNDVLLDKCLFCLKQKITFLR